MLLDSASERLSITCAQCSEWMPLRDMHSHQVAVCPFRLVPCLHADCRAAIQAHGLERHLQYACASAFVKYRVWLIETARRKRDYPRPWGADVQIAGADVGSSIDAVDNNEEVKDKKEKQHSILVDGGGNTEDYGGSDYSVEEGDMFVRPH